MCQYAVTVFFAFIQSNKQAKLLNTAERHAEQQSLAIVVHSKCI